MKNKYVADINDFRKYGLLRALLAGNGLKCGVFWLLTEADASNDGELLQYLERTTWGERLDSELFHKLRHMVHTHKDRTVARVKQEELLPRSQFFEDLMPDNASARIAIIQKGLAQFRDCELVFFDPDNGLEVKSRPSGRKNSSKYLYRDEVRDSYQQGHSLLIYQHFPREERTVYVQRRVAQLREVTGCETIVSFASGYVCFFLVARHNHHKAFQAGIETIQRQWQSEFTVAQHSA